MTKNYTTIVICLISILIHAQENLLKSGPMVGYSTMKEVLLWVQTTEESEVYFRYWSTHNSSQKFTTYPISTSKENNFVAKIIANQVEPDNYYNYELYINKTLVERPYPLNFQSQPLWKWRNDAPDYSFAIGSGTYINETKYDRPGKPYGGEYKIFNSIYKNHPDFMVWLGDNVYLRESDWNSKTGILHRYSHTRSTPEIQPLLANVHHYAIWDDHDFGPNNSDSSYSLKKETEKAFKDFFPNPNYIFNEGTTGFFQWVDSNFFLLDNRYWRIPNKRSDVEGEILGKKQLTWLIDALVTSDAPFKFIVMGGQFLNPEKSGETYSNIAPQEKEKLINAIQELKIEGVIFLTGDIHRTELSKFDIKNGYPIYDLTVSPLTSSASRYDGKQNTLQDRSTIVKERNFGLLKVSGVKELRKLEINILNSEGNTLWSKSIYAKELKFIN